MDTRVKVVKLDAALDRARQVPAALVTGYFDPLVADHVRRLREIKAGRGLLIVLLADPPHPILESAARAQLVAALDVVDYVVLPQECASSVCFGRSGHVAVYREEAADEARFELLVERVHRRHEPPAHV